MAMQTKKKDGFGELTNGTHCADMDATCYAENFEPYQSCDLQQFYPGQKTVRHL